MNTVYVIDALRTPIGKYGGALANIRPDDLLAHVLKALLARNPNADKNAIEDVIAGAANQAGEDNRNVARMAALLAGLPVTVPGNTVNRLCASGLQAIMDSARTIACGDAELMIACGVESMSRAPFVMPKAGSAFDRNPQIFDTTMGWRFVNPQLADMYYPYGMGETAENVAKTYSITRDMQDALALASQQKAAAAQDAGKFVDEIVPFSIAQKKGDPIVFAADEFINRKSNADALAGLRPAFDKTGGVTAGNASGINDGAAAVMVMTAKKAAELGLTPMGRIASFATSGLDPALMGMGPVSASRKALARAGWTAQELDLLEINEAFAAQACAVNNEMGWDTSKVNVNGGAIAIGHPIGASGCRILVTLLHEMQRRNAKKGIASLCIGGGMGVALTIER